MARRNKSSPLEDIIVIIAKLPWWIGAVLALISYLWLHQVASQPVEAPTDIKQMGSSFAGQVWHTFAFFLQFIIPIACLIGAGISAYQKYVGGNSSNNQRASGWSSQTISAPDCPQCGATMVARRTNKWNRAGETFWGCSSYPKCRGTRASAE